MTRRDAVAATSGALMASAALLVASYAGSGALSYARRPPAGPVPAPGDSQGAHAAPEANAGATPEAAAGDDPWRSANANLVDQIKTCQHRLSASQMDLKKAHMTVASLTPDAGPSALRDLYPTTPDEWKELAKVGITRARHWCYPGPDWQPSDDDLAALGLTPSDGPTLTRALAASTQRVWAATETACARIVGAEEAARLGPNMGCWPIILHNYGEDQWSRDAALVANIRAGLVPMPPPDQLDGVATGLLAMTAAAPDLESELTPSFGPELARAIATADLWPPCSVSLGEPLRPKHTH